MSNKPGNIVHFEKRFGLIATKNPAGLIIGGAANIYGEESGKSKVTGRAKQFADDIAKQLKERFQEQGWID